MGIFGRKPLQPVQHFSTALRRVEYTGGRGKNEDRNHLCFWFQVVERKQARLHKFYTSDNMQIYFKKYFFAILGRMACSVLFEYSPICCDHADKSS